MPKYLGEQLVHISSHPVYSKYTRADFAMYFIGSYGQIDGVHHKLWVLDQVARILKGNEIEIKLATWDDGTEEYRINLTDTPTLEYTKWVAEMVGPIGKDGTTEYEYDEGIAP